jgi:hypothetical protein
MGRVACDKRFRHEQRADALAGRVLVGERSGLRN